MYYEKSDFLETADSGTLKLIARARELTREYYLSDYEDTEKREAILRELLGGMGENVEIDTPFHCDHGNNIFLGNDVIIGINCTFVDNAEIRIGNRVLIASNERKRNDIFQNVCASDRNKGQRLDRRRQYHSAGRDGRGKQCDRGGKRCDPLDSCKLCGGGKSLQSYSYI